MPLIIENMDMTEYQKHHLSNFVKKYSINGKKVLEIGSDLECKTALGMLALGAAEVWAVNPKFRKNFVSPDPRIHVIKSLGEKTKLKNNSFDIIFGIALLEHVLHPETLFYECKRLLKRGGVCYLQGNPFWTNYRGHHIWCEKFKFGDETNPLLPWEHLCYKNYDEMYEALSQRGYCENDIKEIYNEVYVTDDRSRIYPSEIKKIAKHIRGMDVEIEQNFTNILPNDYYNIAKNFISEEDLKMNYLAFYFVKTNMTKKILEFLFDIKNKDNHKVVQIFGIKLKFKYKKFSLKKEIEEIKNLGLSNRNNINNNTDKITNEIIKLKQEICSIKSGLNPCGYLSDFEEMFGRYITETPDIGLQMQNLLDCFDNEDKNKILSDLQNNYVRYKSNGKIKFNDLITTETKLAIEKRNKYMAQKVDKGGYWQLDNYKLPVDFFLSEVLYDKLGLDTLNKSVFANRDIIDAGACIGDSALVLSEYTNKNVYAFEPGEKNFKLMEKTIQLNDKKNIIPVMCGLGDKEEKLYLNENYDSNNIGGAYIADENIKNAETAYIIPLDKYVKENNLDVGLIKIDVEGFEQNVLNGAYETIKRCRPTLLISIYHKPQDFFKIPPLLKHWNLNYKFKFLPQYSYNNFITETTVIAEPILN